MKYLKYFESSASVNPTISDALQMLNDAQDVFQSLIDDYNMYEITDDCKPGPSTDKNYYYRILLSNIKDMNRIIINAVEIEIITGSYMKEEVEFVGEVEKLVKRLENMGYKTKYSHSNGYNIEIYIYKDEDVLSYRFNLV